MTSFFVPIFHQLGPLGKEKVLIGLLVATPDKVWYAYSQKKLKIVKQILGPASYQLAKFTLSQIEVKVNLENKKGHNDSQLLELKQQVFGIDYFEYLKKYANNGLLFDAPQELNYDIDEDSFQKLFQNWIGDIELAVDFEPNFHSHIQRLLKKYPIQDKADVGLKISPYQLPGLNGDTFVNLIAQNGAVFAMDTVDFSSSLPTIGLTLNSFEILVNALTSYSKAKGLKPGKFQLMLKKPKSGSEQESLMNLFYKQKKGLYTIIEEGEIGKVIKELEQEDYQKFSLALGKS
jgi:hypothetical protein